MNHCLGTKHKKIAAFFLTFSSFSVPPAQINEWNGFFFLLMPLSHTQEYTTIQAVSNTHQHAHTWFLRQTLNPFSSGPLSRAPTFDLLCDSPCLSSKNKIRRVIFLTQWIIFFLMRFLCVQWLCVCVCVCPCVCVFLEVEASLAFSAAVTLLPLLCYCCSVLLCCVCEF